MPVVRPFGELHLRDELWLNPDDVVLAHLRHLRNDRERRRVPLQRLELRQQLLERLLVEAGADVADPLGLAVALDRKDERPEAARATAFALRVADDHELLPAGRLYLQPVARAPAFAVLRAGPLRHDALEPLLLRCGEKRLPGLEGARHLNRAHALVQ